MNRIVLLARRVVIAPLQAWHATASVRRPCCRFDPSCSEYGIEAIENHGVFYGGWLTLKRVSRCRPWGGFGYDPVPPSSQSMRKAA